MLYTNLQQNVLNDIIAAVAFGDDKNRMEMAGWLGDATIRGNDGKTSFGNDDYIADLDAANIFEILKNNKSLSYDDVYREYYNMLNSGKTRAEMFLEHTDIEYVKRIILRLLYPLALFEADATEFEIVMNHMRQFYPDTYNFIRNLEYNNQEMKDYAAY